MRRLVRNLGIGLWLVASLLVAGAFLARAWAALTESTGSHNESDLKNDLQTLRSQIELYKVQHKDRFPASSAGQTGEDFVAQLTQKTNVDGQYGRGADPAPVLGPYVVQFPWNPFAKANADKIEVALRQNADGDPGWYFDPQSGEFRANDPEHSDL